jgi:hypothetical protein
MSDHAWLLPAWILVAPTVFFVIASVGAGRR